MSRIEEIRDVISKLDNKDFTIHFFVLDTKGNATAAVANIYEHVKMLNDLGYNAGIIHEKNDYHGVQEWLGEEYAALPHISIESQQLNVGPQDFIIIPEVFSNLMEQTANFPAKRIVFSQSYDYILELLMLGKRWQDFNIHDVITTTTKQAEYINSLFPILNTYVVPVGISDEFKPSEKPKKPIVSMVTRDQQDAMKIVKSFYLKYPHYKWVTFRDLRGLSRSQFAEATAESCVGVWVDPISSFGTFPLECIESETPVIGTLPNMIPEWMENVDEEGNVSIKQNGVWVNNILNIPDIIAEYIKVWLEDSVPEYITNGIAETKGKYSIDAEKTSVEETYAVIVNRRKEELEAVIREDEELAKAQEEAANNSEA